MWPDDLTVTAKGALLLQLLFLLNNFVIVQSSFEVNVVNATAIYDKSFLKFFNITLYAREGRNVLRVETELHRSVPAFKMHLKARMTRKSVMPLSSLNSVFDGCQALRTANNKNRIIQALFILLQRSNATIPTKCPVKANMRYGMDHFDITPDVFPGFLPTITVQTNFSIVAENKAIVSILLQIECVRT